MTCAATACMARGRTSPVTDASPRPPRRAPDAPDDSSTPHAPRDANGDRPDQRDERPALRHTVRPGAKPGDRRVRVTRAPERLIRRDDHSYHLTQPTKPAGRARRWLLQSPPREHEAAYQEERAEHDHPWWQVMCLTGVDYFSTLGYQ